MGFPKRMLFVAIAFSAAFFWSQRSTPSFRPQTLSYPPAQTTSTSPPPSLGSINEAIQYFINNPLDGPSYGDQYGELGHRLEILAAWISSYSLHEPGSIPSTPVDDALRSMFPFLQNPLDPGNRIPFTSLRRSFIPKSRGIVIPVGSSNLRFACHLIVTLRDVLDSKLPIQIAYAGETDLSAANRALLQSLTADIEFMDLLTIFNDETLQLATSGYSIKPFAMLASKYEQVILIDADGMFFQPPEVLFEQENYLETGALFFHDRLLWQHGFQDRHQWWKSQMSHRDPSSTLLKSLVWTEDYAEEADSGVVVMDKSRLPLLMGLLHVCWQNRMPIREEVTYKMTYGDKETWWFGLELSNAPYSFEAHYGSIIGWRQTDDSGEKERVCSFTIAHVDEKDELIWFNGSLLKNKAVDQDVYEVPTHWMMDARWEKGGSKPEMSCMVDGVVRSLLPEQISVLEKSIAAAKGVDEAGAKRVE